MGGYSGGFEGVTFGVKTAEIGGGHMRRQDLARPEGKKSGLRVQDGAEDGDDEMGKMLGAFVELEPADNAVIGEIF